MRCVLVACVACLWHAAATRRLLHIPSHTDAALCHGDTRVQSGVWPQAAIWPLRDHVGNCIGVLAVVRHKAHEPFMRQHELILRLLALQTVTPPPPRPRPRSPAHVRTRRNTPHADSRNTHNLPKQRWLESFWGKGGFALSSRAQAALVSHATTHELLAECSGSFDALLKLATLNLQKPL